jgi:predicted RNase H-like nuclease (RuvC/YqgF family)
MEAKLPRIAEADRTPLVKALLAVIASQTGELREKRTLEDENQKLKDAKQKLEDEKQRLEDEKQKLEDKKQRLEDEKRRLEEENSRLRRRLEQYEPEIRYEDKHPKGASKPRSTSYSLGAENKRRHPHRRHKNSSGRQATEVKVAMAQRTEDVYPGGVYHADCHLVRERAVWRLEDGKAILIGYRIFAGPGGREGHIPGVTPRCEYGIEVVWLARI